MAYDDVVEKVGSFFGDKEKTAEKNAKKQKDLHANTVMEHFTMAKNAKEDIKTNWIEYVKLWRGDHWKKSRASWKSQTVENICFSIIETMIPLMGDRMPEINFEPQTPQDITKAKKLNQIASYNWNSDEMTEKLTPVLRDMLILGTGIMKIRWDTEKFNGMGDITADVIDPFHFFPNPEATDAADMEWCILKTKMSVKAIRRIYGVAVPSDKEYHEDDHNRPTNTRNQTANLSSTSATLLEYWYTDDETGRKRVSVVANGVLLDDKETPYEHNEYPFIFFFDHKLNGEFWGIGEFVNLKPLQLELNKVRAMIMDNLIATNNTMLLVDSNSGVNVKEIRNEPGLAIERTPGSRIERLPPPPMPAHFQNQLELSKTAMQEVSGVHDVSKGLVGGSVTAASAIQILTENSQTRLRGKLRNVEHSVKKMAYWYLVLIRQFYTEPRIIRLTGEDQAFAFDYFNGRDELREQVPQIDPETGQPVVDPQTGQPVMEDVLTEFDIKVSSGSTMMMNKSAKFEQVFQLYQAGAVDVETLLRAADIGDPKEIITRMINYGVLKDPNSPKIDVNQILGDLGIHVNMTTNSADHVLNAIQNVQTQIDQFEQQKGVEVAGDTTEQLRQISQLQRDEAKQQLQMNQQMAAHQGEMMQNQAQFAPQMMPANQNVSQ